jgi:DNA polymerase III, delta subunit
MFYILYGLDDFSMHEALDKIKAELGDGEMLAVSTVSLDGEHLTLNELKNNCNAAPFLSSHRLVIVKGLLGRFEPKQRKSRPGKGTAKAESKLGEWENMASCVGQMPVSAVLILVEGKIGGYNPLLKKISSLAKVRTFSLLRETNLRGWIQRRVTEEGGSITPEAVNLLAGLIGGDLWAMSSEIGKLIAYVQGRAIDAGDIRQLVSYARAANIFALVDAIVEGQSKVAQRMLHQMYYEGSSPTYILAMITRQFRLIAQARELSSGFSGQQIQNKLGLAPYALNKTLKQAKLYGFESIRRAYDKLMGTDLAIKTGKYSDRLALELLVAELTSPP